MSICSGRLSYPAAFIILLSYFKRGSPGPSGFSKSTVCTPAYHGPIHFVQNTQKSRPWATFLTSNLITPTTLPPLALTSAPPPVPQTSQGSQELQYLTDWLAGWSCLVEEGMHGEKGGCGSEGAGMFSLQSANWLTDVRRSWGLCQG